LAAWKTYWHFFSKKRNTGVYKKFFFSDLGHWSLIFASISGQSRASFRILQLFWFWLVFIF